MTKRINYIAKALRNIEWLHDYQSEAGMSDESMLTVAIEAQTLASLALVEQQRITNLLTIADLGSASPRDQVTADARRALLVYKQHEDMEVGGWHEARPDIADALGLTSDGVDDA